MIYFVLGAGLAAACDLLFGFWKPAHPFRQGFAVGSAAGVALVALLFPDAW